MKYSVEHALQQLPGPTGERFVPVLRHGSMLTELYAPRGHDPQQPHTQDELYFIHSGQGDFVQGDERHRFKAGDAFFVPAGQVHRFENFSDDFATWVVLKNLFTIYSESRKSLSGMGCKTWCAVDSLAIHKRRNAADRPARHLPAGLGRTRAIGRPGCLHGHEPMRRIRGIHSSRLRLNATPNKS